MDAPDKLRNKQKVILFGGIAAFVVLLMLGMWLGDPNAGKPTPMELQAEKAKEVMKDFTVKQSDAVSGEETWISMSEKEMKDLRTEDKVLRDQLAEMARIIDEMRKNQGDPSSGMPGTSPANGLPPAPQSFQEQPLGDGQLPPPPVGSGSPAGNPYQLNNQQLPPPPNPYQNQTAVSPDAQGKPVSSIQVVKLSNKNDATGQPDPKKLRKVNNYLQAGMFATVTLLSGLDAPTGGQAKSNPVPVLIRIMDPGTLPNHFRSGVKDCHIIGSGYGDIASERVHIRTETISCTLVNGDVIEEPVKGYIAGEDGKAGFRGRLVSKQGALIAKTLLAGALSGMAQSVNQTYQQTSQTALGTVTTIDPNKVAQAGMAGGTSNAMEKLADFYMARANEIYPIIEIDANRIGEFIITSGSDIGKNLIGNTREHK